MSHINGLTLCLTAAAPFAAMTLIGLRNYFRERR